MVKIAVVNQTPYTWYFAKEEKGVYKRIGPHSRNSYEESLAIHRYIYIRYGNHSKYCFKYEFNSYKHRGNTSFILKETFSRSQIQLTCTSESSVHHCPNYGKNEEDKRRQQEEEKRRLERLEREQRIQQELERESELSRRKLSRATERLREKQSFRGHEKHHERTQVLHQQIEDDAAAIEWNEVHDVEEKFKDILLKYQITEDKEIQQHQIWSRIKILQNELAVQYCRENNLSVWSQFTFDQAVRYNELSLTEKLTVLEASLQFIMHASTEDAKDDEDQPLGWEKYHFFLGLVEQLHFTSPTLAEHILLNVLDTISELSPQSREILGQMLFNRLWTPTEIMLLLSRSPTINCHPLDSVLHTAQTYHLDCIVILSALMDKTPLEFLQEQIKNDKEKDADTIVKELHEANCPEKVLVLLKDVLRDMELELPKYISEDLTKEQIAELKGKIRSLNFTNLDTDINKDKEIKLLKDVLIGMSVVVQDCSTIITKDNEKIEGYFPRLTQLASLLLLLLAQVAENKGCLLEIGTGEGKSCILAMFATILAIRGTKVDIVTSSPVLARRDQEEWQKFFEMFGVTSSVVPPHFSGDYSPEKQEECLKDAYRQQIVYGTVGAFAADTLKQEFEKRTTRDTRQFELVIVDEVDYMTLDNGVQVTFLSHESSGLRHVEQVLSNIWAMISCCHPIEMLETGEVKWATRIQYFHKATTAPIMGLETSDNFSANEILLPGVTLGFYTHEDLEMIHQAESKKGNEGDGNEDRMSKALSEVMKKLGVLQQYDLLSIFEEVLENSVVFKCYFLENKKAKCFESQEKQGDLKVEMLLLEGGLACEIMSEKLLIDATVSTIKSSIKYSDNLQTAKESDNFIIIPVFLKSYIENQLPVFVENALKAVEMTRGREYMIDTSPAAERDITNSQDRDKYNAVIPVDFKASGVLEKNKKWGNGLQQFLEFKHQLAISPLSNVTNYLSNFHYFKRYLSGRGIFGVSGTLGGKADQDFLARHYEARSYIVPAHRHKRVVELPVIQVKGGNHQWIQTICETSWKVAERGQVVLVICEDVKTAEEIHKKIQVEENRIKAEQITLYTISEKHNIEREKFCAGRIIIATNLGGRGTDIKVDESVNKCGGLFVLLTHFPHNRRVEKQIFGRTSRKGNPGMVQMVLNCDHLAPAYQGQSVETMRQLREDYEIKRIQDMENDELVEINLKENLFSRFCKLLTEFEVHYSKNEKLDPMRMQLNDIPDCFKHHQTKFDYQPAINALKESWALWLTLHEDHINRHDDLGQLEADLIRTINETSGKLLRGECDNFYDHVKQAIVRTDLHCRGEKSKNDYGAKSYWQKVANSDPHYRAVALYNQAYITINLGKGNYKADAMNLLKDAKKSIDVYISEVSNTMVSCNLSVTGNKDQSTESNNFQSQMEARMNIFKSWMTYIDNALIKLKELEKDDVITEECSVYMLSGEKNFIITNELRSLYDYGLGVVFEVKKKPKFCIDALICFILGMVQVLAGVLVCALTLGTATQFGLGLISEGVNDMISGVEGMIKGTFDWASWAISKSISIGLSLITAGFSNIKNAVSSVFKVTKSLLNGTKSFSSVASEFIKSGKAMFTSFKGGVQSGLSSVSKESFKSAMKNMTSSTVVKENFKFATKYVVQEIGKQSVLTAMNYAMDSALQEFFKTILQSSFKNDVTSLVEQSSELHQNLVEFISSGIPKAALTIEDFKIDQAYEDQVKESVDMLCEDVIPDLILDCTTAQDVISKLSEVCEKAEELMNKAKLSGVYGKAKLVLKVAEYSAGFTQILGAIPTKELIQNTFVPELLENISELHNEMTKYDQDGRHNLHDVQRLKGELLETIAQNVSDQFISSCSTHISSLIKSIFKSHLNSAAGKALDHVMHRHKTQRFFDDQREKHNKRSASHKEVEQLSDEDKTELKQYTEDMCKADQPTTALDVYVLTKSNLLGGKGIELTAVDENGTQLTVERFPGTNKSAGDIKLKLIKPAKSIHPSQNRADTELYNGCFDIVQDDGRIVSVNSDHQNALYHAVAQATGSETKDLKTEALMLRKKVKNEIQTNLELYTPLLILQRGYDFCHKNPSKYSITGGSIKKTDIALQKYLQSVKSIRCGDRTLIRMYHLGFVGEYKSVVSARRSSKNTTGTLNTSHIPPKDSIRLAESAIDNPDSVSDLKNKNLPLYELISSIKTDSNGWNLIAMEVLGQDHRRALTTGPSNLSKTARKLLADTIINGDAELLLKRCMILHHPLTSQKLRDALDESIPSQCHVLSDEGIRGYYKVGYRNLVSEYSRMGILDQNQCERLDEWVTQDQYEDTNTAEYSQVLQGLQCSRTQDLLYDTCDDDSRKQEFTNL